MTAIQRTLETAVEALGSVRRRFECCDTEFQIQVTGIKRDSAARRAEDVARSLESQLDAFDCRSAVSRLNRTGRVENEHVATLVRRGLTYYDRTNGIFDIRQGRLEQGVKAYLRDERQEPPETFDDGTLTVDGNIVEADVPLDLNGLAKGYIVERATRALEGVGRRGFVCGGGDMSPPTGPIAIENPGGGRRIRTLDTDWNVATSGGYRRGRQDVDHIYDPTTERIGSRHDTVTVVAARDCIEADAMATTLAATPLEEALDLVEDWPRAAALIIHEGIFYKTTGFDDHVMDA